MGRLRLVQAACGFGRRALSGFFIDIMLVRHFDRGAVLDSRARESLRGVFRKCDWTSFRALLTPAVVVSFYENARKAFRSRKIRVSATRLPWRGSQRLPSRRCAWRTRRFDVCHGDSIAAMATFFSWFVQTSGLQRDWSLRSLDSVRVEAREGESRRVRCPPTNRRVKWNLLKKIAIKQRLAAKDRSRLRVICATPIQKRLTYTVPGGSFVACAELFSNCDLATEGGIPRSSR